ncbi:FAD binding domain-containing protein [Dactylonectria macrodidyma]|uniref:FAD binding domain-containing protein n=1 Tax=Dactylonectria macrodidyma TaxID=307937 RepID=A0A9P9IQC2_9HYPO|nr:FAD binding domain-containing protein [Dactylonectria macrodidyma]
MTSRIDRISTDVLIIGGGMSGLSAAVAVSSSKARCVIVEKSDGIGGSSKLSAGMFWAPKGPEIALATIPHAEPQLLTKFLADYPNAVEWMRQNGIETHDQFNGIMSIGIGFPINIPQWLARAESIITSNPSMQLMTKTSALRLTQESPDIPGSRVTGAILRKSDGSLVHCSARAVLIATGGFQGSPKLVSEHIGLGADNIFVRSNPYSTGDGFKLGSQAGAGTSRGLSTFYGHLLPSPLQRRDVDPSHFIHLAQFQSGYSVLVNRNGLRFCDETLGDEVNNQELARQPSRVGYMILNDDVRKRWALGEVFPNAGKIDRLEKAKAFGGRVTSAKTVEQLLERIAQWGVPEAALRKTVSQYNQAVKNETAAQILDAPVRHNHAPHPAFEGTSTGPFWALEVQPSITFTYGGLKIDTSARVLDSDGKPVDGLFSCGMDAGGFSNWRYGGGLAQAFVTGQWAGQAALAELGQGIKPGQARL